MRCRYCKCVSNMWLGYSRRPYYASTCIKCRGYSLSQIILMINIDNITEDSRYFNDTIYNGLGKLYTGHFYEIEN